MQSCKKKADIGHSILMYMTVKSVSSSRQETVMCRTRKCLSLCVFKAVGSCSQNVLLTFYCF